VFNDRPPLLERPSLEYLAMSIRPFKIAIPEAEVADLKARLARTRWPSAGFDSGWGDGANLEVMVELVRRWGSEFSWRDQEARLNRMPQFLARLDGQDIHFVHVCGEGEAPMPLVITHGWPGSFAEFQDILPRLTHPSRYGGDPAHAFTVVIPSLPGFGFSPEPALQAASPRRTAILWANLMTALGYNRFALQGGDVGAGVSIWVARLFPDRVAGIHLNFIPGSYKPPLGPGAAPILGPEQDFLDTVARWAATDGAYAHLHSTKPQTLAYALADSPGALAAWIVEKYQAWTDGGEDLENAVGIDHLLTTLSLYWFTSAAGGPLRIYKEGAQAPLAFAEGERVGPPLSVALFPKELPMPPLSWVERAFDVRRWTVMPAGAFRCA